MSRRHVFIAAVAAATAATAMPSIAGAEPPDRFHAHFTDTLLDIEVCGITVDIVFDVVITEQAFFDNQGNFDRFMTNVSGRETWTADNGKSIRLQYSNQVVATEVIDEAAGTITFSDTFRGLPEKIMTRGGPVLTRDAGLITFTATFDLETGDLISEDVSFTGPHPEAESDFTLFCEVITAALS
jgi:hypothetical protein